MIQEKVESRVMFDLDRLKAKDPHEIRKVAKQYASRKLSQKQVGLIAFHAKPALDAIQELAKEISKSQETAFKANAYSTKESYSYTRDAEENAKSSEEKIDAQHHAEELHRTNSDAHERMNESNNSVWKWLTGAIVAVAAIAAYATTKKK